VNISAFAPDRFAGVILAAGASSRMGRDKALLPLDRETFLSASIKRLQPFTKVVIVVAAENAGALKPTVSAEHAELVLNPEPQRGQFSSLQIGLRSALEAGLEAVVVTHVDRPPATEETLRRLMAAFAERSSLPEETRPWAVVPQVEGKHGHPIVVGREMIEAFLRAPENLTARDVEHANQQRVTYLDVSDRNVVTNVNTPEEYRALMERRTS
jgi:CTP:molybdopterin cytidylyltransferase MocA